MNFPISGNFSLRRKMPPQLPKAMKLTVIFLLAFFLQLSAKSVSQVTLSLKNASAEKVFREIERQTGVGFLYTRRMIANIPRVTIEVRNAPVNEVLDKCFQGQPLEYSFDKNTIVITRKKVATVPVMAVNSLVVIPPPPPVDVTGKVTDENGNPLVGVSVTLKGSNAIGTTTNENGEYSLILENRNGVLVFSSVGHTSQEIAINGRTTVNITLQTSTSSLEDVVVVGYGTQKKADLTGAISVIDTKDMGNIPTTSVSEMIKGEVPGVTVENDNAPGGGVAVRIRGFSTIRSNDPLYIIDGVPTTDNLNTLNPNDIASMQILKDASSASIYGSRAANGVVIITTKKGSMGDPKISFNSYLGVQHVFHLPRMLNAQEYGDMLWQAIRNDGGVPANDVYGSGSSPVIPEWLDAGETEHSADIDWVKEIFHSSITQSYNVSVSKGSENAHQYFSMGYYDQAGVMKYTGFKRATARMNSDVKLFKKLIIGENFTIDYTSSSSINNNSLLGGTMYDSYKFPSIAPVKDINNNFAGSPLNDIQNPLGQLYRNKDNKQKNLNLFGNVYLDFNIIRGLHLKSNLGVNYNNTNFRNFSPKYFELGTQQAKSTLLTSNAYNYNLVWSNTAEYRHSIGKHNISILGGTEAVKFYEEEFSGTRIGFPFDDMNFQYLNAGDGGNQTNTGTGNRWSLLSFFGKIDYNYDQRYLLSGTFRRDGSSRLGNNKWGNFSAFSAGWRISQESFFNVNHVNDLKIRFGWGQNGNQDIPTNSTTGGFISDPNNSNYAITGDQTSVAQGFIQSRIPNPDLKWETTTQSNFGLDMSLFNSSLMFTVDYYIKNTKDMLIERPLPLVMGGTIQTFWDNVGTMSNKGIEVGITYNHKFHDLLLNIGGNFSTYRNRIKSLPEDIAFITISSSVLHSVNFDQETSRSAAGQPIGSFYGYKSIGIFQTAQDVTNHGAQPNAQPGDLIFEDINGDGVINGDDRTFIGSPLPKFTYGLNANLEWRNFDFSLFIQGSYGNKIYDLTRYYGDFFNLSAYNKDDRVLGAWSPSNTKSSIPRLSLNDPNNNIRPSSYYVRDGSYARLKNIQIGYSFPQNILKGSLRVYVMAQNLVTVTSYQGMDPEVGLQNYSDDNRNLDIGVDRGIYPPSRIYTVGFNLNF